MSVAGLAQRPRLALTQELRAAGFPRLAGMLEKIDGGRPPSLMVPAPVLAQLDALAPATAESLRAWLAARGVTLVSTDRP